MVRMSPSVRSALDVLVEQQAPYVALEPRTIWRFLDELEIGKWLQEEPLFLELPGGWVERNEVSEVPTEEEAVALVAGASYCIAREQFRLEMRGLARREGFDLSVFMGWVGDSHIDPIFSYGTREQDALSGFRTFISENPIEDPEVFCAVDEVEDLLRPVVAEIVQTEISTCAPAVWRTMEWMSFALEPQLDEYFASFEVPSDLFDNLSEMTPETARRYGQGFVAACASLAARSDFLDALRDRAGEQGLGGHEVVEWWESCPNEHEGDRPGWDQGDVARALASFLDRSAP